MPKFYTMAAQSPSYQTTMPVYPDVSYQTWASRYGQSGPSTRLGHSIAAWGKGAPSYDTWRTNLIDQYNAQVSSYDAWASSPLGNREQLEEAGYNVNYSPGTVSQASPLSYQGVSEGDGLQEISQGVGGLLNLVSAVQGFKAMAANIVGKTLDNTLKEEAIKGIKIDNQWKDKMYLLRSLGLGIENQFRPDMYKRKIGLLGYQSDASKLRNETELASRFGTFMPDNFYVSDNGSTYDLFNATKGFAGQKAAVDISAAKAAVRLRDAQTKFAKMNAREKEFVINEIKPVYRNMLLQQLGILEKKNAFIPTEQEIYRKAFKWKVGLGVANTTLSLIKTGVGLFNPAVGALNAAGSPVQDYGAGFGDQFL